MHIYKSRFLVRGEVWYDHEPTPIPVDWIFYRQRSHPVPGARWKYFYTIVLDLKQSPEELLKRMSKTTAYKIRRGRDKDGIECQHHMPVGREMINQFGETYKRFASVKDLNPLDRALLDRLDQDGFLELSVASKPDGERLVFHTYYRDSNRSCLLHTVSLHQTLSDSAARNAVGRANRCLFWRDILRHQANGLKIFDFGGWYPGDSDTDRLDINQFKEGFGGTVVREFNCEQILTRKARVVLGAAGLLDKARRVLARLRPGLAGPKPQITQPAAKSVTSLISPDTHLRREREAEVAG